MASVVERREMTMRPEYRNVILQDAQFDARVGASEAIAAARASVAATASYELYLVVAQSELPVRLELVAWDSEPEQDQRSLDGWVFVGTYRVPFPSGDVIFGDGGGQSITGPWLRRTGDYTVEVCSRGRDEATARLAEIYGEIESMTVLEITEYKEREGSGIEQYLLQLWPA